MPTIDHIVPRAKGGRNTYQNCVAACKPCNTARDLMDAFEFFALVDKHGHVKGHRKAKGRRPLLQKIHRARRTAVLRGWSPQA